MKICIVASGDYFSTYGGGQVYVKNLVFGLQNRAKEIVIISMVSGDRNNEVMTEVKDIDGVEVWKLVLPQQNIDTDKPFELQDFVLESVRSILTKVSPDIVHANGWKSTFSKVCKEIEIPCVVTAHHGGIVCPNGTLMNQHDVICDVAVNMNNCLVCALHAVPGGDFWSPIIRRLPQAFELKVAKLLKGVRNIPYVSPSFQTPLGIAHKLQHIEVLRNAPDCVIAPSRAIAEALMRNSVPENKIRVVPHGIIPFEKKPLEPGLTERTIRFGFIGRISYVKGLHVVLDALKLLPSNANYELHVYGDAATKNEKCYAKVLQEKSKGLPVVWHGKVQYNNIQEAYYSFDVMLLSSICLEVFGLTVLESLSSGRPVIATRCGGPEDIIEDGVDGMLVEPNDVQDLYSVLKRCIDEPDYVKQLSSSICKINTLENHLNELESIYNQLQDKHL